MRKRDRDCSRYQRVGFFSRWKSDTERNRLAASTKSVMPAHLRHHVSQAGREFRSTIPQQRIAVAARVQGIAAPFATSLSTAKHLEQAAVFQPGLAQIARLLQFGIYYTNMDLTVRPRPAVGVSPPYLSSLGFTEAFLFSRSLALYRALGRGLPLKHTRLAFWNIVYQYFRQGITSAREDTWRRTSSRDRPAKACFPGFN